MDDDTIFLPLGERFSLLIVNRLIRDNYKAVIGNYSTSLIGGDAIRFIGYGVFGLFTLSALERDELGSRFGPALRVGPLLSLLISLLLILFLGLGGWACAPIF